MASQRLAAIRAATDRRGGAIARQIGARTETPPLAGYQQCPRAEHAHPVKRGANIVGHRRRHRVEPFGPVERDRRDMVRSEEHTSELQSLMRNSYAVFCLKKKK